MIWSYVYWSYTNRNLLFGLWGLKGINYKNQFCKILQNQTFLIFAWSLDYRSDKSTFFAKLHTGSFSRNTERKLTILANKNIWNMLSLVWYLSFFAGTINLAKLLYRNLCKIYIFFTLMVRFCTNHKAQIAEKLRIR